MIADLDQVYPDGCTCSESASNTWYFSLTVRIHESRNQGVETGEVAQLLYPNDPENKYFSLFLCPYALLA